MVSKKVISDIVSKYSLGSNIEKVKWVIKDKKLLINFINDSKTLVGQVYYNNTIGLKKGSYGIFNTSQLVKCLNILDGDILIETKSSNGLASKLNLADTNNCILQHCPNKLCEVDDYVKYVFKGNKDNRMPFFKSNSIEFSI